MRLTCYFKFCSQQSSFIFLVMLLVSCAGKKTELVDKYFSIPEFIDQQVTRLGENENQLLKTASFGLRQESTVIDSLSRDQWEKELRIFKEHDINKPVLIDAYQTNELNTKEGERIILYELTDSTGSGILDMEIVFDSSDKVSSWKSSFKEENLLYCNFRELTLSTNEDGMLEHYLIRGYHKLMFKDTVYYQLDVEVN